MGPRKNPRRTKRTTRGSGDEAQSSSIVPGHHDFRVQSGSIKIDEECCVYRVAADILGGRLPERTQGEILDFIDHLPALLRLVFITSCALRPQRLQPRQTEPSEADSREVHPHLNPEFLEAAAELLHSLQSNRKNKDPLSQFYGADVRTLLSRKAGRIIRSCNRDLCLENKIIGRKDRSRAVAYMKLLGHSESSAASAVNTYGCFRTFLEFCIVGMLEYLTQTRSEAFAMRLASRIKPESQDDPLQEHAPRAEERVVDKSLFRAFLGDHVAFVTKMKKSVVVREGSRDAFRLRRQQESDPQPTRRMSITEFKTKGGLTYIRSHSFGPGSLLLIENRSEFRTAVLERIEPRECPQRPNK